MTNINNNNSINAFIVTYCIMIIIKYWFLFFYSGPPL